MFFFCLTFILKQIFLSRKSRVKACNPTTLEALSWVLSQPEVTQKVLDKPRIQSETLVKKEKKLHSKLHNPLSTILRYCGVYFILVFLTLPLIDYFPQFIILLYFYHFFLITLYRYTYCKHSQCTVYLYMNLTDSCNHTTEFENIPFHTIFPCALHRETLLLPLPGQTLSAFPALFVTLVISQTLSVCVTTPF